jgi:hypothetical protein
LVKADLKLGIVPQAYNGRMRLSMATRCRIETNVAYKGI